jgi:hypothetical protein
MLQRRPHFSRVRRRNKMRTPHFFQLNDTSYSGHLNWRGLSQLLLSASDNDEVHWGDYLVERKGRDPFIIFFHQKYLDMPRDTRRQLIVDDIKLHVALEREDIQAAFNPILRILSEFHVLEFKIIFESRLENFLVKDRQYGKIFTIYLGGLQDRSQFIQLARQIDVTLKSMKLQLPALRANNCSNDRVDQLIEGVDFVTYAEPRVEDGAVSNLAPPHSLRM